VLPGVCVRMSHDQHTESMIVTVARALSRPHIHKAWPSCCCQCNAVPSVVYIYTAKRSANCALHIACYATVALSRRAPRAMSVLRPTPSDVYSPTTSPTVIRVMNSSESFVDCRQGLVVYCRVLWVEPPLVGLGLVASTIRL